MVTETKVFEETLKHKGYFNYADLYNFCYNYLKDENFKVVEKEYTEKVSGDGKEIIIKWEPWKEETDYFKFVIKMEWHILRMVDAEVEQDGKKVKTNKGELKIKFKSHIASDYRNEWDVSKTWKFLRGVYDKYIVKTTMDEFEIKLISRSEDFVEQIKAFLVLEGRR